MGGWGLEEARDRSLAQSLSSGLPSSITCRLSGAPLLSQVPLLVPLLSHYYQLTPGLSLLHFLRNMLSSDSHRTLSLTSLQGFLSVPESLWAQGADSAAGSAAVTYISSPLGPGCGGEVSRYELGNRAQVYR